MATWPVPLGGYRALFADGYMALYHGATPPAIVERRRLSLFNGAVDPWFFPRGCMVATRGRLIAAFIGLGQWSGRAKAWRTDLGGFAGLEVDLGPSYGNHGRGIRPGPVEGSFELTWLSTSRVTRFVQVWNAAGALEELREVAVDLPAELLPPADGFIDWQGQEPDWTHVPSTIRVVRGRKVGRPCWPSDVSTFVVGDDCEAPAGVDRVVAHDGREWHVVRGGKPPAGWNTGSKQSQIDGNGLVGLVGDGTDLFVEYADWFMRPVRVVDAGEQPDRLDEIPDLGGRPFTVIAHVDHAAMMKHPEYGNVVIPVAAGATYIDNETRPMVEALSNVAAGERYGRYCHFQGGDVRDAVNGARGIARDRVVFYPDFTSIPTELMEAIGDVLEPGDVFAPQYYRQRGESERDYMGRLLYAAEWQRPQLAAGVLFMPYIAAYRRGVSDPWLSTSEVIGGVIEAANVAAGVVSAPDVYSPWDGLAFFGFDRQDFEPAVIPYIQRLQSTSGGPVPLEVPMPPTDPIDPYLAAERLTVECFGPSCLPEIAGPALAVRDAYQWAKQAVEWFDQEINRLPSAYECLVVNNAQRVPQPNGPDDAGLSPARVWTEAEVRQWIKSRPKG